MSAPKTKKKNPYLPAERGWFMFWTAKDGDGDPCEPFVKVGYKGDRYKNASRKVKSEEEGAAWIQEHIAKHKRQPNGVDPLQAFICSSLGLYRG